MAEENAHDFKSLAESEEYGDSSLTPLAQTTPKWQWVVLILLVLAVVFLLVWYFVKPKFVKPIDVVNVDLVELDSELVEDVFVSSTPNNLIVIDTDQDGLSDEDEIGVWLSDPNNQDSDGDTYLDGQEVLSGYSPISTSTLDLSLYITATPQRTLDSLAKAINENNVDLWLKVLASENVEREIIAQAGSENLNFMHIYYQNKPVSFVIKNKEILAENKIKLSVDTLLVNVFFENKDMIMVNENSQWKILE